MADLEKNDNPVPPSQRSSTLSRDEPIEYRTLTHDTPVPSVATPASGNLPKPPQLKKYADPLRWSTTHKNVLIAISCIGTMITAYSAGTYAPAVDQMEMEFGVSRVALLVGVTIFTIGFGVAPMVLGMMGAQVKLQAVADDGKLLSPRLMAEDQFS